MTRLLGILLLITGIYLLGKNIIFATTYFSYYHHSLPAIGSALAIIPGTIILVFFSSQLRNLEWILLGIGIVSVFLSGGVILRPTSPWNFFISFTVL